jgi:gamma-glutamyltranspeptidase / glutathione hydrolase / leukotriene-C4 hydrolase
VYPLAGDGPHTHTCTQGPIARNILSKIHATGGIMTQRDLELYTPIVQPALEGTYHGRDGTLPRRIYTTPAPTSGPVVLHILNLLEGYNLIEDGPTPLNIHRIVESLKCAPLGYSS